MPDPNVELPYSPEYVEGQLRQAGRARALWRVLQILSVLVVGLLLWAVDRWRWTYRRGETTEDRQRRRARWLLGRIVWLGPTFVKVGQSLATRPDLLPLAYLHVLSALHDRLPSFPDEVAYALVEEELGWRPDILFQEFDARPFAAASLGQVYHAVTHEGEEVAVKVQRPDLVGLISLDLALVRRLAGWVERHPRLGRGQPWVSLVDEFGAKLFEELDYVHEGHLTERFRQNVQGMGGIYAPKVYWELSSRRVLTTEYIAGIKITEKEALLEAGVDVHTLLSQGVRANLKQLFEDGLFHADPHPGNLLVCPAPTRGLGEASGRAPATLVFIDFGMMGIIRPEQKERILEIFVDVINRRPENLRDNLIALGCLRPDARWGEIVPLANRLFQAMFGDPERRHTFQEVTHSFAPLVYEYEFRIPVDFALIVRAIMTLEGISRQLDPDFDIWSVSAPYAARMMLTFPNPGLRRRLLAELLTEEGELDQDRLRQLAGLAARDRGFRLETSGLVQPALDLLLSPEGADLRRALVAELLRARSPSPGQVVTEQPSGIEALAPLFASDPSFSGRAILNRLVAFLLSPAGAETRAQIEDGLRSGKDGDRRLDVARAVELATLARRLHPDFRPATLLQVVGAYLLSEGGRPIRNQLLLNGAQRILGGLADRLRRLTPPQPAAFAAALPAEGD